MTAPAPIPGLLTESQAAAWLSICPRTLRQLRKDGKIHYVLIRASVRYTLDDLHRYVESARTCQSTKEKARPSGGTASRSKVFDFEEARARRRNGTPS